jgi:TolB protein
MNRQPRRHAHRSVTVSILAVLAFVPCLAQGPTLEGTVEAEGFRPVNIAVANPVRAAAAADVAAEIVDAIRFDLGSSGYFNVVDPQLYGLVPASDPNDVRYEDWESIGADALVSLKVSVSGGRLDVVAWLHDTPSKKLLLNRRYAGEEALARRIGHQISDELVQHYTGRPGIALTRIAFVSKHGNGKELYLMDYDGRRLRRLTTTGTINLSPVWSPLDGSLAFVSWRGRQPGLYILDNDGTLRRVPTVGGELNTAPDWSPNGDRIVYSSDAEGNSEIYVLDVERGTNTRLTHTWAIETSPAFSPTGREIAFTSDRSGTPQIYVMDAEGLNPRRVSLQGNYNESPAWAPRGDRLAYVSRIDGRFDVVVLDLTSGRLRRLTHGEGSNEDPRWSPDGRHIVFASNRKGTWDIYTMRSDGSQVRRLTRGANAYTPDWSP